MPHFEGNNAVTAWEILQRVVVPVPTHRPIHLHVLSNGIILFLFIKHLSLFIVEDSGARQ